MLNGEQYPADFVRLAWKCLQLVCLILHRTNSVNFVHLLNVYCVDFEGTNVQDAALAAVGSP